MDGEFLTDFISHFGLALSALLPLINPLGSALFFVGLVGPAPPEVYRRLARKIAFTTTLFLLAIDAVGTATLKFFGISLGVMQVSGGLVLAAMEWGLLNQSQPQAQNRPEFEDTDLASLENQVFYPFTFPVTAGPGCVVVMITLSAHASREGGLAHVSAHSGIALAIVLLSVAVYVCYGYAPVITARVRPQTAHGILRVVAFVLMCIGVQITWNGVEALLTPLLRR